MPLTTLLLSCYSHGCSQSHRWPSGWGEAASTLGAVPNGFGLFPPFQEVGCYYSTSSCPEGSSAVGQRARNQRETLTLPRSSCGHWSRHVTQHTPSSSVKQSNCPALYCCFPIDHGDCALSMPDKQEMQPTISSYTQLCLSSQPPAAPVKVTS